MTRPGPAVVGVCRRSPPGLKPHARRGEDAGLRVRGLWCFERLIQIGHRDRLAEPRIPSSAPSRPAMVVTLQPVAAHAPSHGLVGRLCSTFGLDPRRLRRHSRGDQGTDQPLRRGAAAHRQRDGDEDPPVADGRQLRQLGPWGRTVLRRQGHAGPRPPSSPTTTARGFARLRACRPRPPGSPRRRA
jgi:hypothetical protein